jgi:ComF family protein
MMKTDWAKTAFTSSLRLPGHISRHLVNAVLPPRCLKCGTLVTAPGSLCAACWSGLDFLSSSCCACCGYPFDVEAKAGALCARCLANHPPFQRSRAAFAYDDGSRDMILAFKHADRMELAKPFARWMAQAGRELLAETELIVPVPLHWQRLLFRRYNQAALLATALGRLSDKPVLPDLLQRRRATAKQGHLSRLGRARNVKGAFTLRPAARNLVAGKRVLLIDDVITTGATIDGCCQVLIRAGAAQVDVLALAQVIHAR